MSDTEAKKNGEELATRLVLVGYKRFFIDVKQNARGRFIKIAEISATHRSRILLSMTVAKELVDLINTYLEMLETTPAQEGPEEGRTLRSDQLFSDSRRYYIDLKENSRGRFLRIAQTMHMPRPARTQIAISSDGLVEVRDVIADFIDKFGQGYMETAETNADRLELKGDLNKMFYFDKFDNDRGSYVRISEVKGASNYHQSITVPTSNLVAFRANLTELIDKLALEGKTDIE